MFRNACLAIADAPAGISHISFNRNLMELRQGAGDAEDPRAPMTNDKVN